MHRMLSGFLCIFLLPLAFFSKNVEAVGILWETTTDFPAKFYEVTETTDGRLVIAGTMEGRPCLFKYEIGGDTLWTCLGMSQTSSTGALAWVDEVPQGYITCGSVTPSGGDSDYLVALIGFDGELIWSRTFDTGYAEGARAIIRNSLGYYYVTGYRYTAEGLPRVWTMKLSSLGNTIWAETWGNVNTCRGINLVETPDGNITVIAQSGRPSMLVYDHYGNLLWNRYYWEISVTSPRGLTMDSDGYCFATFFYCKVCRTNLFGDPEWIEGFSAAAGTNCFYGLKQTQDSGYIAVGWVTEYQPDAVGVDLGITDGWIVRISPSGTAVWFDQIIKPGSARAKLYGVIQRSTGGYIAVGNIDGIGWQICYSPETGIDEDAYSPVVSLDISPNPFSASLGISYSLPEPAEVKLSVYDLSGRLVEDLISGSVIVGENMSVWNPDPFLPNGCYLIMLDACGERAVRRVVLLR